MAIRFVGLLQRDEQMKVKYIYIYIKRENKVPEKKHLLPARSAAEPHVNNSALVTSANLGIKVLLEHHRDLRCEPACGGPS